MKKKQLYKYKMISNLGYVIRFILGCMFLVSAIPKIRQPYDFLGNVYSYEITGPKLGMFVAMTMPWAELIVGFCLLGSIFVTGALLISITMGIIFTFVLSWAIYHNLDISCGCFGSSKDQIGYGMIIRAVLIIAFSFIAYLQCLLSQPVK